MAVPSARQHVDKIREHSPCSENGAIDPATALFHEDKQVRRRVSEGSRIRDELDHVASVALDVDLKAHDAVFSKVFICLSTGWSFA